MRRYWIPAALLAAASASPSSAQISVYIGTPPPAIVYEEPGPPPAAGFVWIEGYWQPAGHRYKWIRGHWERPPMRAPTGRIRTSTTTTKVGNITKGIGIARTTTTATGRNMAMGADMAITTIMIAITTITTVIKISLRG